MPADWTASERRTLLRLNTPWKVQHFLDALPYSVEDLYRCPRRVLRDRTAHCADGALFAAAAFAFHGRPPLLTCIDAVDDDGHMLALFKSGRLWGAVAKSNFVGLRYREPVYRSLRELVMSYFDDYFNSRGKRTMRTYTAPLNLNRFSRAAWNTTDEGADLVLGEPIDRLKVFTVLPTSTARRLIPVDDRRLKSGLMGANRRGLYKPAT